MATKEELAAWQAASPEGRRQAWTAASPGRAIAAEGNDWVAREDGREVGRRQLLGRLMDLLEGK